MTKKFNSYASVFFAAFLAALTRISSTFIIQEFLKSDNRLLVALTFSVIAGISAIPTYFIVIRIAGNTIDSEANTSLDNYNMFKAHLLAFVAGSLRAASLFIVFYVTTNFEAPEVAIYSSSLVIFVNLIDIGRGRLKNLRIIFPTTLAAIGVLLGGISPNTEIGSISFDFEIFILIFILANTADSIFVHFKQLGVEACNASLFTRLRNTYLGLVLITISTIWLILGENISVSLAINLITDLEFISIVLLVFMLFFLHASSAIEGVFSGIATKYISVTEIEVIQISKIFFILLLTFILNYFFGYLQFERTWTNLLLKLIAMSFVAVGMSWIFFIQKENTV